MVIAMVEAEHGTDGAVVKIPLTPAAEDSLRRHVAAVRHVAGLPDAELAAVVPRVLAWQPELNPVAPSAHVLVESRLPGR